MKITQTISPSHPSARAGGCSLAAVIALVLAALGTAQPALAQSSPFQAPISYLMGPYQEPGEDTPASFAVGHFNKDRALDLLVLSPGPNALLTRVNSGTGQFPSSPLATAVAPFGDTQYEIKSAADFTLDGKADVLLELDKFNGEYLHSLRLGDGSGKFKTLSDSAIPAWAHFRAAGDFTGDGKMDLLVDNRAETGRWVLPGDGKGKFGTAIPTGVPSGKMLTADFNNDGKLDLLVDNGWQVSVWLRGNAAPFVNSFSIPSRYDNVMAVEDFNRDGRMDFLVVRDDTMILELGYGNGGFHPSELDGGSTQFRIFDDFRPNRMVTGDFNGDGWPDLAVTRYYGGTGGPLLSVLLGEGHAFGAMHSQALPFLPENLTVGDFNNDGLDDLVYANSGGDNIYTTVMLAHRATPAIACTADSSTITFDIEDGNVMNFKGKLTLEANKLPSQYRSGTAVTVAPTFSFSDFYLADWTYPYLWNVTVKDIKLDKGQETWSYAGPNGEKLVIKWTKNVGTYQFTIPDDSLPAGRQPRTARVDLEINAPRFAGHSPSAFSGQTALRITRDDPYALSGSNKWTYPGVKR